MASTFQFLSGSLALENKPFHVRAGEVITATFQKSHGYVGYKFTTLGRASEEDVPSFMLVTKEYGVVLVDVVEEKIASTMVSDGTEYWVSERGEVTPARTLVLDIYEQEVVSRLKNDLSLYDRKSRSVRTPVTSAIVFCENDDASIRKLFSLEDSATVLIPIGQLEEWLRAVVPRYGCSDEEFGRVCSLLEGTFVYEARTSPIAEEKLVTVNDYIQKSLRVTFKQDEIQRLAAMQLPPGPQRIRGLAGTGKTVVLCLKAAITHKRFDNFRILYLFNTQSLYQHVQGLIAKYYTMEAKKPPDFDQHLHVLHAWGGRQKPGLYSNLCQRYGLVPMTLADARGQSDALQYIYRHLLSKVGDQIEPEYDLVLIDEAQDFPSEVFQVAFKLAKGVGAEKRIIWAYDEFQSLRDTEIKGPSILFGNNEDSQPNIPDSALDGKYAGDIPKDFVLPNCYRTPRPVLMTAHGVAMALYTDHPAAMFYYPQEWSAIGYKVNEPRNLMISAGDKVEIERPDENSKNLLETILKANGKGPLNLVQVKIATSDSDQLEFLKEKIGQLVSKDGVPPEEIIIINLSPGNNKKSMLDIQQALDVVGIRSVIPGYVESADVFKPKGLVTITTPFRAKGNEANVVFVVNSHRVADDFTLRMRNAFFVAVTRSRGWCYVSGIGLSMTALSAEIDRIKADFPRFKFIAPDPASVRTSRSFLNKSDRELDKIQELLELVDQNPELRDLIVNRSKNK